MKQLITVALIFIAAQASFAQSGKYAIAMKKNIAMIDSIPVRNNAQEIINNFTRIGDAEKDKWLPYYYAAYVQAFNAILEKDADKKDGLADQASELLNKASDILQKDNSEIEVIKSMIATAHLTVDPQSRYMTYGPASSEALKKAEALDSTNPRPVLLEAQAVFYTPEAFGGGKDAAKPLFDKAAKMFAAFKPENDLAPQWGEASLQYFLNMYQ